MATSVSKRDRTRRGQLQRVLGDRGTILPCIEHATPEHPARGWYAELLDGSVTFLGDNAVLAGIAIDKLGAHA